MTLSGEPVPFEGAEYQRLGYELCVALGLDPEWTQDMTIELSPNTLPKITVTMTPPELRRHGQFTRKTYELTEVGNGVEGGTLVLAPETFGV